MTGPDPAVAVVRLAVRRTLAGADRPVLVACSGGADSLALLAATVFESRERAARVVGVVVDHGLQPGSAEHTARVVDQLAGLGADETASIRVRVDPGPAGVEAGAREARYVALSRLAQHFGAGHVLLGHTRDDQAETVLLGLVRGSGGRSLGGMRPSYDDSGVVFARPLLPLTRAQTEAACRAEGVDWWTDPHNSDDRFVRARIRQRVLPVLERELGPGVAAALARTADLVRADVAELDAQADAVLARLPTPSPAAEIGALGEALRLRVLRGLALRAGAPAGELSRERLLEVDRLVTDYRGQRWVELPGHLRVVRDGAQLRFEPAPSA